MKVLVVDDSEVMLFLVKTILEMEGLKEIFLAKSAEEALKIFKKKKCDLVITDYILSGPLNGIKLTRLFKLNYPKTKIIFLTGQEEVKPLALQAKADVFLVKKEGVLTTELIETIKNIFS